MTDTSHTAEGRRLEEDARRIANWKRWGPYLSERQWGTVREDYSADGGAWEHFPHDHARSRAYRWGEDGLLGITDRECRLAFALALWNGEDPFLKERLFGLTNPQGNHGEDVKELYYYLDSTPTHSYMKALYKYPLARYPYERLVEESRRRGFGDPELEIADTGVFEGGYADVTAEYAKAGPDDVLVRVTVANRGEAAATIHVLPTLWFRNTWSWGRTGEGYWPKPRMSAEGGLVVAEHASLGRYVLAADRHPGGEPPELLFTENETNTERLFGVPNPSPWVKDAFHEYVVAGRREAVNPGRVGTKAAAVYRLALSPGESAVLRLRLQAAAAAGERPFAGFDVVFAERRREADAFFAAKLPEGLSEEERRVARQGDAGLLWTKQYYQHLHNRDVVSMPDKWEYPWYPRRLGRGPRRGGRGRRHEAGLPARRGLVDQLVGQFVAHVCGLGPLVDPAHARTALKSILRHNMRPVLWSHFNNMRAFAVVRVIRAVRGRYDGARRNPFDEAECGHHYARAMASWAAVLALTGFRWFAISGTLELASRPGRHFWSSGSAWGTFVIEKDGEGAVRLRFSVAEGELALAEVRLAGFGSHRLPSRRPLKAGESLEAQVRQ